MAWSRRVGNRLMVIDGLGHGTKSNSGGENGGEQE